MAGSNVKTYELKARFTAEADVSGVEKLERRLNKLHKTLNQLDKQDAKITIKSKGAEDLERSTDRSRENLDQIGGKKKIKPRVDDSDIDKTAAKLERLAKLSQKLNDSKFSPNVDDKRLDRVMKKAKSAQKQAFDIEYEAKLIGDDTMRRKAQQLQNDLEKTFNNSGIVREHAKAQQEMQKEFNKRVKAEKAAQVKLIASEISMQAKRVQASRDAQEKMNRAASARIKSEQAAQAKANKEAEKGLADRARMEREMGKAFANRAKANKKEIDALNRSMAGLFARAQNVSIEVDTKKAYAEIKTLGTALKAATARAYRVSITAENADLKAKAAESYKILQSLDNMVASARVDLQNQTEVTASVARIRRNLQELTTRPWELEISGDISEARAAITNIGAQARAQFSKAYELEIRAETENIPGVMAEIRALKMEALSLSQNRARLAVEIDGIPKAIAGLFTLKRALNGVEGTYEIRLDTDKIKSAAASLLTFRGASNAARAGVMGMFKAMGNAQNAATTLSRGVFVAQQVLQGFLLILIGIGVVAAGPLVAGLMIAVGAVGALGAAIGLVAAVAAPVISSLTNFKENAEKTATATNSLRNANVSLAQAEQGVVKANQQVATTSRQNAQAISGAIKAHEDAVRGVASARKQYAEAVQGVHDAEVQGEEQVQSAVESHAQSVRGIEDAQRNVAKTVQGVSDAQVQAEEQVEQAIRSHADAIRGVEGAQRQYVQSQREVNNSQYAYVQAQREVNNAQYAYVQAQKAVNDAQYQFVQSQRASADAQYQQAQSQRATENAQYDYKMAAQASTDAQKELTFATEDYNDALATEQQRLLGLNYDLEGLQLNQRQLALDMIEARNSIGEATTPLEAEQAALRLEELQLRQKEGILAIDEAQRSLSEAQTEGTGELQSAYEQQQSAGQGVQDSLRQQEESAYSVQDAIRQQEDAAFGVQDAIRQQEDAALGVEDAQRGVGDAAWGIEDAQRGLQDAAYGVEDAFYAQEQAALGVRDAQDEVGRTAAAVQKAQQDGNRGIADAVEANQLAQRDLTDALYEEQKARAGIGKAQEEASRGVLDAQGRVMDAQQGIDDALRGELEAREGIAEAQVSAAESMQGALDGVEAANMRLKDAQDQATEAQRKFNEAMEHVPSEKITQLHDAGIALWDRWKKDTAVAQQALVDFGIKVVGLGDQAMPALSGAAINATSAIIEAFDNIGAQWTANGVLNSFQILLRDMAPIARDMVEGLGNIFGGLINTFAIMSPFVKDFAWYIRDVGERFLAWTSSAEGRDQIYKFFQVAGPVARLLRDFLWEIGGALLSWSVNHPEEVQYVLEGLLWVLRKIIYFIAGVIKMFIWLHSVAPGLTNLIGVLGGIAFAILLIPRGIRQVLFYLFRMIFGFGAAGMAGATMGARVMFALRMIGRVLIGLGGVFLIFNGVATGSMWQIALGIGMVAFAFGMSLLPAVFLAAGAFFILTGVANESFWMIALGIGLVAVAFGMTFIGAIFLAAGAFFILTGVANESFLIIAIGIGLVAMAFGLPFWSAVLLAAGVFFIFSGVANDSFLMIALGLGALALLFGLPFYGAVLIAAGAFLFLSGTGISAMDLIALAVLGLVLFFPAAIWRAIVWVGSVAIMGYLVPAFMVAFTAIAGIVAAGAAAMGIPVWLFVLGAILVVGLLVVFILSSFDHIFNFLSPMFAGLWKMWNDGTITGGQFMIAAVRGIVAAIFSLFATVLGAIPKLIANALSMLPGKFGSYFATQSQAITDNISRMRESIAGQTAMIGVDIGRNLGYGAQQGMGTMSRMGESIKGTIGSMVTGVKGAMGSLTGNIIDTSSISNQVGSGNMASLAQNGMSSIGGLASDGDMSMQGLKDSIIGDTFAGYQGGSNNIWAMQDSISGSVNQADLDTQASMSHLATQGVDANTYDAWTSGANNTLGAQQDMSYNMDAADVYGTGSMAHLSEEGVGANTYNAWGYGSDNTLGAMEDMTANLGTANTYGSGSIYDLAENGIGVNMDNAWGYADTSTLGLRDDASQNIKESADYGSAATGEWGSNMGSNIGQGVSTMLKYLGTDLVAGVNSVMSSLGMTEFIDSEEPWIGGMPTSWSEFVTGVPQAEGGLSPNLMAEGGTRGGVGSTSKNPQHITWNEQNGNEAWVAQKGPKEANMGYLSQAASWFDMSVVPSAMADGGMAYMAHGGISYGFTPEVASHAQEVSDAVGGGISYNTYEGHPDGYPEREQYSVDFWGPGGRGDNLQSYDWGRSTGDKIVSLAQQYPDFSYYIWNGQDSMGGQGAAEDAHFDHVHVTWMGDIGVGGGITGGAIANAISTLMPEPPDVGSGLIASTIEAAGQMGFDSAKSKLMSHATSGAGKELDMNVAGNNLQIGEQLASQVGWTGSEWDALKELWTRESGWNENAVNSDSGAYGIPQINPNSHGYPVPTDSAAEQIAWGIDYIQDSYTNPSTALAHHDANNWYAEGGVIAPSPISYSVDSMYSDLVRRAAADWTGIGGPQFSEQDGGQWSIYDGEAGEGNQAVTKAAWDEAGAVVGPAEVIFDLEAMAKSSSEENYGTALHELGHVIGLDHNTAQSVMNVEDVPYVNTLQPYDAAQFGSAALMPVDDPTWLEATLDPAILANAKQLAQQMVDGGAPMPTFFGAEGVEGRGNSIDKETSQNSAYFYGPNEEPFGAFYGDDYAAGVGNAAAAQADFSYWTHKGKSNIPFFNHGQYTTDELKVVWAGNMDAFVQELAAQEAAGSQPTVMGQPQTAVAPAQPAGIPVAPAQQAGVPVAPVAPVVPVGAGTLDDWITQGIAMGGVLTDDAGTHQALYDRAMQESTGDPMAVNDWDSNAIAGTPSKGLMQVIQPTWDAYTDETIGYHAENWMDPVKSVAVATRYMNGEYGGVVGSTGYGYARGGVGSQSKDPKNITWNEGAGNEAWISQNGPKHKNVSYLNEAASWFGMDTVPMEEGGLVYGSGPMMGANTWGKKNRSGGEDLGPTHYGWGSEVQGYVDSISGMYPTEANTYVGHGNPGGATEDMTADFWGVGGRGVPIDTATGDAVSGYIWDSLGGNLAYMIWNGMYYNYDGSVFPFPEDPHPDHVHASWGAGGWGGGNVDNGLGAANMAPTGVPAATPVGTPAATPVGTTGTTSPTTGGVAPTATTPTASMSTTGSAPTASMPTTGMGGECSCDNMDTLSSNQGALNDSMGTLSGNQSQLASGMGTKSGPFTANTDSVQSGGGTQSSTSGDITQNLGTGMSKMANDPAMGVPGVAGGVQDVAGGVSGMNTDMNTGLTGIDSGIGELNSTMGSMCDPASGLANPAIAGTNSAPGYTGSNVATNQAVDSYTDTQNTGTAVGGGNIMMGGKSMSGMGTPNTGISPDTALLGGKMDDLTDATYQANEETELGSDSLEQIVKGAVAAALGVISSKGGRDIIDENLSDKMNFDTKMKGM